MPRPRPASKRTGVRFDRNRIRLHKGECQRENGTYVYRWTDSDSKRHSVYAPTLDELRAKEEQVIVDRHDGIKRDGNSLSVNDMFDLWCQLKRGIKDSTLQNYVFMYETYVRPTFGQKRLVRVKKSDVRAFYNRLSDDKILKISTIDIIHNILHQVFQVAVDDDLMRHNPTDNMMRELKQVHGSDSVPKNALTIDQQNLFLDFLWHNKKYQHWYPIFYIMVHTGMRAGEITGLRWCDIDMEKGVISVNHTLVYYNHRDEKGSYFSINTPKSKAGKREIPMTEGVKNAFRLEKEFQEEIGLQCVDEIDGYGDFVFVNRFGHIQHHCTLNKALSRIIRDCNGEVLDKTPNDVTPILLPHFSCHILRHTFATRLAESGVNVKFCQSILGHADITTTFNIYVSVTDDFKRQEINTFSQYMSTGNRQTAISLHVDNS